MKKILIFINPRKFGSLINPLPNSDQELFKKWDNIRNENINRPFENEIIAINQNNIFQIVENVIHDNLSNVETEILFINDNYGRELSFNSEYKVLFHSETESKENLKKTIIDPNCKGYLKSNEETNTIYGEIAVNIMKNSLDFNDLWSRIPDIDLTLELKLELLHSLLVPLNDLKKDYLKWNELSTRAKYTNLSTEFKAWNNFITKVNGQLDNFNKNPFEKEYIVALSDLRDELLNDY